MRFKALDSWRGIAALLVALFHLRFLGHFYDVPLVRHGWLMVDFFFVLSGFVITHAYGRRLRSIKEAAFFVVRRFGRLWPLHIALLVMFAFMELLKWGAIETGVLAGAFAADDVYSIPSFFSNVLLLHSLGLHDQLTWNMPSWSISTEFYTCVAFALLTLLPHRLMQFAFPVLALACLAIVSTSGSYLNTTYDYGFFRCVLGFLMGHFTYRAFGSSHTSSISLWTGLEYAVVAGVVLFISALGQGAPTLAAPFVFSCAVFVFAREGGSASALLLRGPFQKLGEWSYSIYMVHMLVFTILSRGLLVMERATGESLRIQHVSPTYPVPVEVFFFRTNLQWMPSHCFT